MPIARRWASCLRTRPPASWSRTPKQPARGRRSSVAALSCRRWISRRSAASQSSKIPSARSSRCSPIRPRNSSRHKRGKHCGRGPFGRPLPRGLLKLVGKLLQPTRHDSVSWPVSGLLHHNQIIERCDEDGQAADVARLSSSAPQLLIQQRPVRTTAWSTETSVPERRGAGRATGRGPSRNSQPAISLNRVPVGSVTAASRPHGVSSAGRSILPPSSTTCSTAASRSSTLK